MNNNETLMFYINAIHDGGAERVIIQLAHHFAQAGYRSILVTSFIDEDEYPVPNDVLRLSLEEAQKKQSRIIRNVTRICKLRRLCKYYKPSALISFMAEPNFRAIIATTGLPIKNIVSVRNDPNREYCGRLGRIIGKRIIPKAEGCVFQTVDAKLWFPEKLQCRSRVIFNDVNPRFFETQYCGGKNIVTLGRLSKQKNHKMLISAFADIAAEFPDCDLLIYGKGTLRDSLLEQISELGLNNRVHMMGLTDNSPAVLSHAGLFVLSSDYEGLPNALLEALAIGVPCISTDCPCGGPRSVISNGENGILVPVGDCGALANAMRDVLSNPQIAKGMSLVARKMATEYRPDAVFKAWKEYVQAILDN